MGEKCDDHDKVQVIKKSLHVSDATLDAQPSDVVGDRTLKIKIWFDRCNRRCGNLLRTFGIDEIMIKGASKRNPIRQRMQGKPIKAGSKSFTAVDELGVILYTHLYKGAKLGKEKKLALHVVEDVLQFVSNKGHYFFVDNWYESFAALEVCKNMDIIQ